MLELLAPAPGENILDIGSGSGWQTALLAHIVSHDDFGRPLPPEEAGHVVGLEHIPELAKESISRLHQFSFISRGIAEIHAKNGESGFSEKSPYQAIVVAAGVREVMPAWKEDLVSGGRLVFPKKWSIIRMKKGEGGAFSEEQYEGYIFVPFIREDDYDPDSID
jgi:protein-L-isoaspartate(D-aspartate) O-methyltransferase